ncbi:hypothetical protein PDM95_00770 [Bacillus cereus]|uniref:Phage protein n=1 Tax=Bacillus tropicus TaxID=2026188 RepID=A0A7T2QGT1_9BACI|nr:MULTISPECIES: hypothetical protein [Bacillus cereus group]AJG92692.1 putative phage protein [Bacillus cereus]MDA2014159.1 hypothetical protein [Bacillus cereus]MED2185734.1 hypothetical protein [Bacillus wiedmannii]QPR78473.1 hypothetical protein I6G77_04505 [Bacillus tropicus]
MLTEDDIKEIRENREMIEQGRREPVILHIKGVSEKDPITGEEIRGESRKETVKLVWKKFTSVEKTKFADLDVKKGEALVTFPLSVDLENIEKIERKGVFYVIELIDERGLGGVNRREVIVKRVI